jgi:hypothetical protein
MKALLTDFQGYSREHYGVLDALDGDSEGMAQLVFMAFLNLAPNGCDLSIDWEYALGYRRIDLSVIYKDVNYPVELKIKTRQILSESLRQIRDYMDICGSDEGWLVIFDNDIEYKWEDKLYWKTLQFDGKTIHILDC